MRITPSQQKIQQAMNEADRKAEQPTCPTCGGSGKFHYTTYSSGQPIRVSVRCLACTEKPDDPWRQWS